jgi:DNA-binding PadR family transcriptional regulator
MSCNLDIIHFSDIYSISYNPTKEELSMDYSDRPGPVAMYALHRLYGGNVIQNTEWGFNHPSFARTLSHAERKGYVKFIKKTKRKRYWVITQAGKDLYDKYKCWFKFHMPGDPDYVELDPWDEPIDRTKYRIINGPTA